MHDRHKAHHDRRAMRRINKGRMGGGTVRAGPVPGTPHHQGPRMSLAWLLWLLDALDAHPARTSAGVPPPGAGLSHSTPSPAESRTQVGACPGERHDPGLDALGLGRHGWPKWPSAACQNWRSGFGEIVAVFCDVLEEIGLSEPGPQFREGKGRFSPAARVGLLGPRFASHDRLGRVVSGGADRSRPGASKIFPQVGGRVGRKRRHGAHDRSGAPSVSGGAQPPSPGRPRDDGRSPGPGSKPRRTASFRRRKPTPCACPP
jgi:hypothetical protein